MKGNIAFRSRNFQPEIVETGIRQSALIVAIIGGNIVNSQAFCKYMKGIA